MDEWGQVGRGLGRAAHEGPGALKQGVGTFLAASTGVDSWDLPEPQPSVQGGLLHEAGMGSLALWLMTADSALPL